MTVLGGIFLALSSKQTEQVMGQPPLEPAACCLLRASVRPITRAASCSTPLPSRIFWAYWHDMLEHIAEPHMDIE